MGKHLLKTLVRGYYFNEALAFYQQYYRPLIETYPPAREALQDTSRHEDPPPPWVPHVFDCVNSKITSRGYSMTERLRAIKASCTSVGFRTANSRLLLPMNAHKRVEAISLSRLRLCVTVSDEVCLSIARFSSAYAVDVL